MIKNKLLALDLLEEELIELTVLLKRPNENTYIPTRIQNLKDAIAQLESISLKSDCIDCRYNQSQEELSELNEEEYIRAFDKCRTCANYYTNNYEAN